MHDHDFNTGYRRDSVVRVTKATALTADQQTVLITNGTYAITLPPVAEAAGKMYSFYQTSTGTNSVTLSAVDDLDFTTPVINAQYEHALVYSDGLHWFLINGATS